MDDLPTTDTSISSSRGATTRMLLLRNENSFDTFRKITFPVDSNISSREISPMDLNLSVPLVDGITLSESSSTPLQPQDMSDYKIPMSQLTTDNVSGSNEVVFKGIISDSSLESSILPTNISQGTPPRELPSDAIFTTHHKSQLQPKQLQLTLSDSFAISEVDALATGVQTTSFEVKNDNPSNDNFSEKEHFTTSLVSATPPHRSNTTLTLNQPPSIGTSLSLNAYNQSAHTLISANKLSSTVSDIIPRHTNYLSSHISTDSVIAKAPPFTPSIRSSIWSPMNSVPSNAIPVPRAVKNKRITSLVSDLSLDPTPVGLNSSLLKPFTSGPLTSNTNLTNIQSLDSNYSFDSNSQSTWEFSGLMMPFPLSLSLKKNLKDNTTLQKSVGKSLISDCDVVKIGSKKEDSDTDMSGFIDFRSDIKLKSLLKPSNLEMKTQNVVIGGERKRTSKRDQDCNESYKSSEELVSAGEISSYDKNESDDGRDNFDPTDILNIPSVDVLNTSTTHISNNCESYNKVAGEGHAYNSSLFFPPYFRNEQPSLITSYNDAQLNFNESLFVDSSWDRRNLLFAPSALVSSTFVQPPSLAPTAFVDPATMAVTSDSVSEVERLKQELALAKSRIDQMHSVLFQNNSTLSNNVSSGEVSNVFQDHAKPPGFIPSVNTHNGQYSETQSPIVGNANLTDVYIRPPGGNIVNTGGTFRAGQELISGAFGPGHSTVQQVTIVQPPNLTHAQIRPHQQPRNPAGLQLFPDSIKPVGPTTATTNLTVTATMWPQPGAPSLEDAKDCLVSGTGRDTVRDSSPTSSPAQAPIKIPGAGKVVINGVIDDSWSCGVVDWGVTSQFPSISATNLPGGIPARAIGSDFWVPPRSQVPQSNQQFVGIMNEAASEFEDNGESSSMGMFLNEPISLPMAARQNYASYGYNGFNGFNGVGSSVNGMNYMKGPELINEFARGSSPQPFQGDAGGYGSYMSSMRKMVPIISTPIGGSEYDSDSASHTDNVMTKTTSLIQTLGLTDCFYFDMFDFTNLLLTFIRLRFFTIFQLMNPSITESFWKKLRLVTGRLL